MSSVCIITDSTAQFTQSDFPGQECVHVIALDIQNTPCQQCETWRSGIVRQNKLISPSPQQFIRFYARLSLEYDSILVLLLSSFLNPTLKNALSALNQHNNGASVEVIDTQTTALGLGMLVQLAAGAASDGASLGEIIRRLRASIPRVYTLFCIPEPTYLAYSGLMDNAQALVAEMMGMLSIFAFEEGRLVPMEKVRTPRHMFEAFQDFMGEFEFPSQIALLRSSGRGSLRTGRLRQYVKDTFPATLYSEHPVQPYLATLLGPHSIGLFVMESVEYRDK
jgi:DegV family protein with EDD domain